MLASCGIGATGKIGEEALAALGGKSQKYFKTTQGARYVDRFVNGVAHEAKVGYQSLTKFIRRQISKDAELKASGDIQNAAYHFFKSPKTGLYGPSKPLMNELQKNGIDVL